MFPLQSSPTPLGPLVSLFIGLAFVGAVVGALGSAVVQRRPNPVAKYRLLYAAVLVPFALLAYGLLAVLGFGTALVEALSLDLSGLPGTVLADLAELLAAGLVWLVAYAPTVRGVRRVRDIELSTGRTLGRMTRYVLGLSLLLVLVIAPIRLTSGVRSLLVVAVDLAAFGVLLLVASPWLLPVLRSTRRPTDDLAASVSSIRTRAGLDVSDVLVIDTDEEETASAFVRGFSRYRRLFVTSTFLDRFDDETAAALLAIQAGRLRSRVLLARVGTVLVSGLLLVASFSSIGPRWPLLGASLGTLGIGCWYSRRGIRAADEYAAKRVGVSTVVAALERYAAVHAIEPARRRVPNPLSVTVALGDRIDRLTDGQDA